MTSSSSPFTVTYVFRKCVLQQFALSDEYMVSDWVSDLKPQCPHTTGPNQLWFGWKSCSFEMDKMDFCEFGFVSTGVVLFVFSLEM